MAIAVEPLTAMEQKVILKAGPLLLAKAPDAETAVGERMEGRRVT